MTTVTDFKACPSCGGPNWDLDDPDEVVNSCHVCDGTGERQMDQAAYMLAVSAQEALAERVDVVFCLMKKIRNFGGYGIESFDVGQNDVSIVQDDSRRGCYDRASHSFPTRWLWMQDDEVKAELGDRVELEARLKREKTESDRVARIAQLREELKRLEAA